MIGTMLAAHLVIFGDSLSSPTGCEWSRHLQDEYAIQNYAQAGVTADAFSIPSHWRPRPHSKLVIWIGSNDAGAGLKSPKDKIRELVKTAKLRGVEDILIVGLPKFIDRRYRYSVRSAARAEKVGYLPQSWGSEVTSDGVHPTCEYHEQIAADIRAALEGE